MIVARLGARLLNLKLPLSADIDPSRGERHGTPIIGRDGVGFPRPGVGTLFALGGLGIINVLLASRHHVFAERLLGRGTPPFGRAALVEKDGNPGPEFVCSNPMAAGIHITGVAIDLVSGVEEVAMSDSDIVEISLDRPP